MADESHFLENKGSLCLDRASETAYRKQSMRQRYNQSHNYCFSGV